MLVQVYVDDITFGSTKKSMCTEFEDCMHKRIQMSSMGELTFFLGLQVKQQPDGLFISQDKDEDGVDVDVHVYRSMIGSLMYLTTSRPDIMYLKHQPKLGLWYPRDSPFELEAFSDSDYRGGSLDRKSTTGGYQFLGRRLISWQCKKQTIVANSTTGQNMLQLLTVVGNVIKNPVAHSRTKHIKIRFHFIRDCYEKRLIEVIKIHTDHNVADLLTKGFDVTRFNFLVSCLGFRESLEKDIDGTEELLLPDLFILWLTKVSTDSANSIHYAITVSPVVSTIFVEQFWMSAKSKIINNARYITAKVAVKPVNISEASIRSDLLFDDADGIDSLHNQAIFDAIQLMIRCDNGTEFKNKVISEFCKQKGIKREYSVARTPQQNGIAERRNRTLIEAARTMLADSKLPTTF
ncbi:putative ribonuclease H-like domain-containing protein [Tanacetum coccineum]